MIQGKWYAKNSRQKYSPQDLRYLQLYLHACYKLFSLQRSPVRSALPTLLTVFKCSPLTKQFSCGKYLPGVGDFNYTIRFGVSISEMLHFLRTLDEQCV
jgi:hypothetical protein